MMRGINMLIEIKHRFTNNVLYTCEAESMREAVLSAVKDKADLRWADLRWADLRWANLRWANLRSADLNGEVLAITPIFINGLIWDIRITESFMKIGCERHEHKEWDKFTDDEIERMESRASEFWKKNKSWLMAVCESHRKQSLVVRKAENDRPTE
jgi:Pentapeptide repeats (8 copies)